MFKSFKLRSLIWLNISLPPVYSELLCQPAGPVVPRPVSLSSSPNFLSAARNLGGSFSSALNGTIRPGFSAENVSFSVAIVSLAQEDPGVPIWEYHHLSPANTNGTKELTRHSQYLIGSVSKVLSDTILLKSGLDLEDSITKYLPELAGSDSPVKWENISLGALASQLSGIPPNYGFSDFYYLKDYFVSLGFPPVNDRDYPLCGVQGLNEGCTREQFLQGMLQLKPVGPPQRRPVYSNIAFSLFVFAVESATRMNYTEQLRQYVTSPLGMASTTVSPGVDDRAVIPPVQSSWGRDYGDNAPGGGLVSTTSDLSTFFHAILSRNESLLPPTIINSWLKSHSSTGSSRSSVGTPWEIFTPDAGTLTPDHPHSVPIYAKNGAAFGYNAQVAMVDDYGLAIIVLTAGNPQAYRVIYDATLSSIVRAVDEAARVEANERGYTGSFEGSCSGGADQACFNVTIEQDDDSLKLSAAERNGSDVLAAVQEIWAFTVGQFLPGSGLGGEFRIFPAEMSEVTTNDDGSEVVREDWRIWWPIQPSSAGETRSDIPGVGFSAQQDCLGWTTTDWLYYGNEALDRIVFVKDSKSGMVVGLDIPYLRTSTLRRALKRGLKD